MDLISAGPDSIPTSFASTAAMAKTIESDINFESLQREILEAEEYLVRNSRDFSAKGSFLSVLTLSALPLTSRLYSQTIPPKTLPCDAA